MSLRDMLKRDLERGFTDWEQDCVYFYGEVLKGRKAHWCADWDDLPIDENCLEFEYCTCDFGGDIYG